MTPGEAWRRLGLVRGVEYSRDDVDAAYVSLRNLDGSREETLREAWQFVRSRAPVSLDNYLRNQDLRSLQEACTSRDEWREVVDDLAVAMQRSEHVGTSMYSTQGEGGRAVDREGPAATSDSVTILLHAGLLGVSVLCLGALFSWPYAYYELLRWIVFISLLGIAIHGFRCTSTVPGWRKTWTWASLAALGPLAMLYNPIIPVHMDRGHWRAADLFAAFLIGGFTLVRFVDPPGAEAKTSTWIIPPSGYAYVSIVCVAFLTFGLVPHGFTGIG